MTERCPACKGAKQVMRLGMIYKDCEGCGGLGHIKKKEKPGIPEKIEHTYDSLKESVEVFSRYPENPDEHYKEAIENSDKRLYESLKRKPKTITKLDKESGSKGKK